MLGEYREGELWSPGINDQYQQMIDSGNTICTSCLQSLEDATQLKDEIKRLITLEHDLKKNAETSDGGSIYELLGIYPYRRLGCNLSYTIE